VIGPVCPNEQRAHHNYFNDYGLVFPIISIIIYLQHTSRHIYYYVYNISTTLIQTSRRPITLIIQKCDKHNSKYDMMCSVNMRKVL